MKNNKQAFTLAEVLLVLAIIGVIAAVTIPAIMQQSSEKKFAALAKKAVSTLQNAIDLKIASTPLKPSDYENSIFAWLTDGEEDGTNTLKVAKMSANSRTVQLPDGTIIHHNGTFTGYSGSLGIKPYFYIDLNGSDPPTKTTVNDLSEMQKTDNGKAYDVIFVALDPNGMLEPWQKSIGGGWSIETRTKRAKKYFNM